MLKYKIPQIVTLPPHLPKSAVGLKQQYSRNYFPAFSFPIRELCKCCATIIKRKC